MPPKGRLVVQIAKFKTVELGNQIVFKWTTRWSETGAFTSHCPGEWGECGGAGKVLGLRLHWWSRGKIYMTRHLFTSFAALREILKYLSQPFFSIVIVMFLGGLSPRCLESSRSVSVRAFLLRKAFETKVLGGRGGSWYYFDSRNISGSSSTLAWNNFASRGHWKAFRWTLL